MRGIGTVAIDGPRFEEFLRFRKGSRKDFAAGLHSWVNIMTKDCCGLPQSHTPDNQQKNTVGNKQTQCWINCRDPSTMVIKKRNKKLKKPKDIKEKNNPMLAGL